MQEHVKAVGGAAILGFVLSPLATPVYAGSPLTPVAAPVVDASVPLNHRTIAVPGSDALVQLWDEVDANGAVTQVYSISLDGSNWTAPREASYDLKLRFGSFDPLAGAPATPASLEADASNEIFIVQFVTQPLEAYRNDLHRMGGQIYKFLANNAYIVRMDAETRAEVESLPYVRWVGAFHPAYKLEESLLEQVAPTNAYGAEGVAGVEADANATFAADRNAAGDLITVNIMVFEKGPRQKQAVANRIRAIGGRIDNLIPDGYRMVATVSVDQLNAVVGMNEVMWVDLWSAPEPDMNIARDIGGALFLESTLGMTGQGVRGEVMDDGIRGTHVDFQNPPVLYHGGSGFGSHGTSTYGITFGSGVGNASATGVLPDAEAKIFALWSPPNRYSHTQQLVDPSGSFRGVFQTNSWGNSRTRSYSSISAEMDDIIFDNDLIITQSQSNAGNQDSRPQAWAKNIVSVGGVYHRNTLTKSDDAWSFGGSIGPASDGRIKPDFTHFYDSIFTTSSSSDTSYTSSFGGTSGATPITAGYFGLMYQMWHQGQFPGFGGGASVFDSRPHFSTAKALMVNSAEQYTFSGTSHDLTRTHQGWGMADVEQLYNTRNDLLIINETDVLLPLQTNTYGVNVDGSFPELKVTMIYADPMGVPNSSQHRINDLTLKVTSPSGTIYYGNNGLLAGNYSTAGGAANTVDTVENVFVNNPELGTWTIEVSADEINEDGHVETGAVDADFALVASGGVGEPGMILSVPALFGGQQATISVENATPGETVAFLYSLRGQGSTFIPQLNVTVDLQSPRLGGTDVADGNGDASLTSQLPDVGPLVIWLQAAEFGRKSNLVVSQIN
ncbi:MAG: S8 family serine peptidase [Phycisphaerales bacterium]